MPNTPTTSSSGASSSAHPSTVRHSDVHPIPRAISHLQNLFTTQLATLQSAMQGPHSSSRAHPSPTSSSATPSTAPSLHPTSPTNTPHPAHSVHTDASHAGDPGRRHSGSACRPAASASSSLQWPSRSTAACSSSSNRSRPVHPAALSRLPLCCCSLSNPQANRRGAKQHSGSAGGGSGSTPCDCSSCNASSAAPLGSGHRSVPGSAPHLPTASDSSTASQPPQAASDAERKQRGAAARGTAATGAVPEPASVCIAAAVCVPGGAAAAAALEAVRSTPDHLQGVKLLFSGAMAALVSRTCVAPFERVKMDLVLKSGTGDALSTALQVWRTEGVTGFWKGNALNVLRTAPFKAINFFSFDTYLRALTEADILGPNVSRFAAGAMAGVTATLVCFPLDVVRTRLLATIHQGPRYGGPLSTLQGMLRNEGIHSLYSGCLPAVIGMAPAGAVFYGCYDLLKRRHLDRLDLEQPDQPRHAVMDPLHTLGYGAMAGAASELIVYPLEVIRRRMQLQSMAVAAGRMGSTHAATAALLAAAGSVAPAVGAAALGPLASNHVLAKMMVAWVAIMKADGVRGFYAGLLPNMMQVLPSAALSYYTYDSLKTALNADSR
ncbi:MAG: hypothetical protein WDW36_007259 [Sanguina aurantia]